MTSVEEVAIKKDQGNKFLLYGAQSVCVCLCVWLWRVGLGNVGVKVLTHSEVLGGWWGWGGEMGVCVCVGEGLGR